MKNQIIKISTNIMGTASILAKFDGMRKAQEFTIYPMSTDAKKILCQSDSRWLEINPETGDCEITTSQSGHHSSWMLQLQKSIRKHKEFKLSEFDLQSLKMQIFTTASKNAGKRENGIIQSDNSAAIKILG